MDNLEKQLLDLPKPKLSKKADFRIKSKIYFFVFYRNTKRFFQVSDNVRHFFVRMALSVLVIIFVLTSTSLYAYADDSITLGDTLYPLKKVVENLEQKITVDKNSKVDTLGKISEKRAKEALNLVQENKEVQNGGEDDSNHNIKQTINEVVNNIDSAMKTSDQIDDDEKAQKARQGIKQKNDDIIKYLDDISDIAETNKNDDVVDEINKVRIKIDKYNEMLDDDHNDERIEKYNDQEKFRENNNKSDEEDDQDNRLEVRGLKEDRSDEEDDSFDRNNYQYRFNEDNNQRHR